MLFQELGKLKRSSIMNSIMMMAAGIIMIICPEPYISMVVSSLGYVMIIVAIVKALDFIVSKRVLMDFINFTIALVIGILGIAVLTFSDDVVRVLALIFGIYLIVTGVLGGISAFTYARRSERKGWQALVAMDGILTLCGLIVLFNPWWGSPAALLRVVGYMLLFSSIVGIIRLVYTWPIRSE